jgi:amino acid transporter/nucleotide-binding universal stress UspA family protein
MLVSHTDRPRELKWYHAGPMLYGDWGTSRFYVLGLALFYALHASFWYVFAVGLLVAAVGWAYTIICRCYPDGGGVYSAAKHTNRQLAVVGALLLFADYIVTASLSAYDGIRYMGLQKPYVLFVAMGAIFLVGVINFVGPKKAGAVALVVALATLFLTAILTVFSIPHLATGWVAIHRPTEAAPIQWSNFVAVVLALSGVEAIANMTGIMVPPVPRTANKAIWPVLVEVVLLNLVLAVAMNGLPAAGYDLGQAPGHAYQQVADLQKAHSDWRSNAEVQGNITALAQRAGVTPEELTSAPEELKTHVEDTQDAVLRVMAKVYVDPHLKIFSWICGFVFGALLLSAVNTAVADMVSIQYVMSRDTELPRILTKLNIFGVPWYALVAAVGLPIGLLCIFQNVYQLANLYAVGVVGAIAINLGSCSLNREMPVKKWERTGLVILAAIMVCIEATLIWEKPDARYFAGFVLCSGLLARFFTKTYPKLGAAERGYSLASWAALLVVIAVLLHHFEPVISQALHDKVVLFEWGDTGSYAVYLLILILLLIGGASANYGIGYLRGKIALPAPVGRGELERLREGAMPAPAGGAEVAAEGAGGGAGGRALAIGPVPAEGGEVDLARPHVLVATRGAAKLLEFAANYCRKTGSIMFPLFVRQVNVLIPGQTKAPGLEEDREAVAALEQAVAICRKHHVPMIPMYAVSSDVAYTILDFAATYNAEAVLMGVSRQGTLLRALRGDVITAVADNLPEDISLLVHA